MQEIKMEKNHIKIEYLTYKYWQWQANDKGSAPNTYQ